MWGREGRAKAGQRLRAPAAQERLLERHAHSRSQKPHGPDELALAPERKMSPVWSHCDTITQFVAPASKDQKLTATGCENSFAYALKRLLLHHERFPLSGLKLWIP